MHYRACVISKNADFAQFVRLTLLEKIRPVTIVSGTDIPTSDIYVVDLDTVEPPTDLCGKVLLCSAVLPRPVNSPHLWADRPFRPARLLALLDLTEDKDAPALIPYHDRPCVLANDREIMLSAKEHALLMALWDVRGTYVSREELLSRVWGDEETDPGVVNVYIHYLRRKLETDGQKRILASRGRGYMIKKEEALC